MATRFGYGKGDELTSRNRFARLMMEQNRKMPEITTNVEGFGRLFNAALGGMAQREDVRQRRAADEAFTQGMPQGYEASLAAMQELPDNEYAQRYARDLRSQLMATSAAEEAAELKHTRAMEVAGAKPVKDPTSFAEFEKAKNDGYGGTYAEYLQDRDLWKFGVIRNKNLVLPEGEARPGTGAATTIIEGSRADIAKKTAEARDRSTTLAEARHSVQEERLRILEKNQDPEVIMQRRRLLKRADLEIDNERAMPGRRFDIMTKTDREPILERTIEEIKDLSSKWSTGGTLGQMLANRPESDQYALNKKMEQIKAAVGLQELIDIKAAGGTFGALSDTEMSLLISAVGALDPYLDVKDLGRTLDDVMRLYSLGLARKKMDFAEMYPDVKRPWEKKSAVPTVPKVPTASKVLQFDEHGELIP